MIPKIIHFCWLSHDEYPEDIQKCMRSWKEKLPDYEIIHWNTENFDVNIIPYTAEAFAAKKYAFVSDYIRLYALYHYGGIYLDSDIEVLKNMDDLLENRAFTGFEDSDRITAWMFGSEKGNPLFKEFMDDYEGRHFLKPDGSYDLTPNPVPITRRLVQHGLVFNNQYQELDQITVYPMDYFCPFNPYREGKDQFTEHTYMNHYFSGAWKSDKDRMKSNIKIAVQKVLGKKLTDKLVKIVKH